MNPDDHENTAKEGDVKAVKAMSKKGLSTAEFCLSYYLSKIGVINWLSISLPSPDTFPPMASLHFFPPVRTYNGTDTQALEE